MEEPEASGTTRPRRLPHAFFGVGSLLAFSNPTTVRETGGEEREPNSIERAVVLKREGGRILSGFPLWGLPLGEPRGTLAQL
jgi:hypothetical protein